MRKPVHPRSCAVVCHLQEQALRHRRHLANASKIGKCEDESEQVIGALDLRRLSLLPPPPFLIFPIFLSVLSSLGYLATWPRGHASGGARTPTSLSHAFTTAS